MIDIYSTVYVFTYVASYTQHIPVASSYQGEVGVNSDDGVSASLFLFKLCL